MKAPILLAAFIVQHSAFGIAAAAGAAAAEPPPAAAQEGVQLWEDGPNWADRNIGADEPWEPGLHFGAKGIGMDYCWDRHMAMPVRPVRDE